MAEAKNKRSEATRKAILKAAEEGFADYGFAGARVDQIAENSGYNKTLIFRYYGDKLGLYAAVLQQADREWSELLGRLFTPLLHDESLTLKALKFRKYLKKTFEAFFDYMAEHPHFARMINWEQADRWKTLAGIASQFEPGDLARLKAVFSKARQAGLLRKDLDIIVMIVLVQQSAWSFPNALPLYQLLLPRKDLSSAADRAYVRKKLIEFLLDGIIGHPGDRRAATR